ncbi:bifunctional hydroxymethylpyrimidine kinase/phosphomethylpyrimidine kinase [Candidatus Aminicenantes bacterium AH-873-B07]|jgi:hydroxymethylpyrimidine/phosphomethylpyrimidine kinase|nr:bifunctional hydroxymethylpyrimidine kinase/phosphomethylpyrimidine kinase [Candidatus Aminicenantes bacterium AH-873-B07]
MKKALLSLAGFDPTGGAGILLDCKVFKLLGFHGLGIITANTIQNTTKFKKFSSVPSKLIIEQYEILREDIKIEGVKVGMIGNNESLSAVEYILNCSQNIHRVIDPVFKSSSGQWLIQKKLLSQFCEKILPLSEIITPNLLEASILAQMEINTINDMKQAAEIIYNRWKVKSIIKGGHLNLKTAIDVIFDGNEFFLLEEKKIKTQVHGTGCFFSSALLGYLCQNNSFFEACKFAKKLTFNAIKNSLKIGKGQKIIIN